jgi:phage/plasmid-associated DNA primase
MLNFAVPVFSTNEFWPSSDTSTGYFDRWLVLPFLRPVSGKFDESTLHAEASGIFNKAAGALRALQARESGKRSTRFTQSASVAAVKDEMRGISDSVFMWLKEDTAVVQDVTKMGIRSDVYSRYVFWCWDSELGGGITPVGARKFWPKIRSAGYIDHKSDGKRYVVGLHVAQEKVSA